MFAPKIIKSVTFFQVTINNVKDAFWRIFVHFDSYFVRSFSPGSA